VMHPKLTFTLPLTLTLMVTLGGTGATPASSPKPEHLWLLVGASDSQPAGIARKAKALARAQSGGLVIQTKDCGDKKNVFAWVAEIANSAEEAQAALPHAQSAVKDAYVKRCDVVPRSLLALRFPAVDPSIADVPDTVVNWEDEDRTSSTVPLTDGRVVVIARYFVHEADDPLEGRRERVVLAGGTDKRVLVNDCPSPDGFTANRGRVAFACAREQAGDELLHSVLVFGTAGDKVADIPHCRKPRWSGGATVVCDEESVNAQGRLKLRAKRIVLTDAKAAGP